MSKKILVVDDSPVELANLRMLLHDHGYDTVTATTGREGVEKAIAEMPSLILLDIMMPDMDGYEVARGLRADPFTSNVPLIALTGYGQLRDKETAALAGFDAHLVKPVDPDELVAMIEGVLGRLQAPG